MKRIISFVLGMLIVLGMISVNMPVYATEMVDTSIEKGQEIYQNFLDTTAFMETDSTWENFMKSYANDGSEKKNMKVFYLETVADATDETYAELSSYETYIYIETYVRIAGMVGNRLFDTYIQNKKGGVPQYIDDFCAIWSGNNIEEVKEAFASLLEWQFAYFRENNYPYNFITGKSYAEETGLLPVEEENQDSGTVDKEVQEELGLTDEEVKEIEDALTEEEIKEIKGATDKSKEEADKVEASAEEGSKWWLVIPVVLILGLAFLVMKYVSKKKESTK